MAELKCFGCEKWFDASTENFIGSFFSEEKILCEICAIEKSKATGEAR